MLLSDLMSSEIVCSQDRMVAAREDAAPQREDFSDLVAKKAREQKRKAESKAAEKNKRQKDKVRVQSTTAAAGAQLFTAAGRWRLGPLWQQLSKTCIMAIVVSSEHVNTACQACTADAIMRSHWLQDFRF